MECYLHGYYRIFIKQPLELMKVYEQYKDYIHQMVLQNQKGTIKYFISRFLTAYALLLIDNKFYSDLIHLFEKIINLRNEILIDQKYSKILNSWNLKYEYKVMTFYLQLKHVQTLVRINNKEDALKLGLQIHLELKKFINNLKDSKNSSKMHYILNELVLLIDSLQKKIKQKMKNEIEKEYSEIKQDLDQNKQNISNIQGQLDSKLDMKTNNLDSYLKLQTKTIVSNNQQQLSQYFLNDSDSEEILLEGIRKAQQMNNKTMNVSRSLKTTMGINIKKIRPQTAILKKSNKIEGTYFSRQQNLDISIVSEEESFFIDPIQRSILNYPVQQPELKDKKMQKSTSCHTNILQQVKKPLEDIYKEKIHKKPPINKQINLVKYVPSDNIQKLPNKMVDILIRPSSASSHTTARTKQTSSDTLSKYPNIQKIIEEQEFNQKQNQQQQQQQLNNLISNKTNLKKDQRMKKFLDNIPVIKIQQQNVKNAQQNVKNASFMQPFGTLLPFFIKRFTNKYQNEQLQLIVNEMPCHQDINAHNENNANKIQSQTNKQQISATSSSSSSQAKSDSKSKSGSSDYLKSVQDNSYSDKEIDNFILLSLQQKNPQLLQQTKNLQDHSDDEKELEKLHPKLNLNFTLIGDKKDSIFTLFKSDSYVQIIRIQKLDKIKFLQISRTLADRCKITQGLKRNQLGAPRKLQRQESFFPSTKKHLNRQSSQLSTISISPQSSTLKKHDFPAYVPSQQVSKKQLLKLGLQQIITQQNSIQLEKQKDDKRKKRIKEIKSLEQILEGQSFSQEKLQEEEEKKIIEQIKQKKRYLDKNSQEKKTYCLFKICRELKIYFNRIVTQKRKIKQKLKESNANNTSSKQFKATRNMTQKSIEFIQEPQPGTIIYTMNEILKNKALLQKIHNPDPSKIINKLQKKISSKKYPSFEYSRFFNSNFLIWKVQIKSNKEDQKCRIIFVENEKFVYKVNLNIFDQINENLKMKNFNTIWPLLYYAFTDHLLNQEKIDFDITKSDIESQVKIQDIHKNIGFIDKSRSHEYITSIDLSYMGKLKHQLSIFFQFLFYNDKKPIGSIILQSNEVLYEYFALIPLKMLKKQIIRYESISIEPYKFRKLQFDQNSVVIENTQSLYYQLILNEFQNQNQQNSQFIRKLLEKQNNKKIFLVSFFKKQVFLKYAFYSVFILFDLQNENFQNNIQDVQNIAFVINLKNMSNCQNIQSLKFDIQLVIQKLGVKILKEMNNLIIYNKISIRWQIKLIKFFHDLFYVTYKEKENDENLRFKLGIKKDQQKITQTKSKLERNQQDNNFVPQEQLKQMNSCELYFYQQFAKSHNVISNSKKVDMQDILKTEYSFIDDEQQEFSNQQERKEKYGMIDWVLENDPVENAENEVDENSPSKNQEQNLQYNLNSILALNQSKKQIYYFKYKQYSETILLKWIQINPEQTLKQTVVPKRRSTNENLTFSIQNDYQNSVCNIKMKTVEKLKNIQLVLKVSQKNQFFNFITLNLEKKFMVQSWISKLRITLIKQFFKIKSGIFQSTFAFRCLRSITEFKQLIPQEANSLKDHCIIKSHQMEKFFEKIKYRNFYNIKNIGLCLVQMNFYIVKKFSLNPDFPFQMLLIIQPQQKAKTTEYKFSISFQDLLIMNPTISKNLKKIGFSHILCQKLLSYIISQLTIHKQFLTKSVFIPQNKYSYSNQKYINQFLNIKSKKMNLFQKIFHERKIRMHDQYQRKTWNDHIEQLKQRKNFFIKQEYELVKKQQNLLFCEQNIRRFRTIIFQIKRLNNVNENKKINYMIFSLMKDMVMNQWCIQVYIPKTCRTLITYFNSQDLEEKLKLQFLTTMVNAKHRFFFENNQMSEFDNYSVLKKRLETIYVNSLHNYIIPKKITLIQKQDTQIPENQKTLIQKQDEQIPENSSIQDVDSLRESSRRQTPQGDPKLEMPIIIISPSNNRKPLLAQLKLQRQRSSILINKQNASQSSGLEPDIKKGFELKLIAKPNNLEKKSIKKSKTLMPRDLIKSKLSSYRSSLKLNSTPSDNDLMLQEKYPVCFRAQKRIRLRKKLILWVKKQIKEQKKHHENLAEKGQQIINKKKQQKQELIKFINTLTTYMDNLEKEHEEQKLDKLKRYIEFNIWERFIDKCCIICDDKEAYEKQKNESIQKKSRDIFLSVGDSKFRLQELLLFNRHLNMDQNNSLNISVCIDLSEWAFTQQFAIKYRDPIEYDTARESHETEVSNMDIVKYYFNSIDFIPYTSTNLTTFSAWIFIYQKAEQIYLQINVIEIINFFIAEGFYKFQTNYLSSRLQYADLKNISHYVVHKVKNSSFVDMIENKKYFQLFPTNSKSAAGRNMIYIAKNNIIYFKNQLIDKSNKLMFKSSYMTKDNSFKFEVYQIESIKSVEQKYNFNFIQEKHIIIRILKQEQQYHQIVDIASKIMLDRMQQIFNQKYNIENQGQIDFKPFQQVKNN